jgi:hypothetical protein
LPIAYSLLPIHPLATRCPFTFNLSPLTIFFSERLQIAGRLFIFKMQSLLRLLFDQFPIPGFTEGLAIASNPIPTSPFISEFLLTAHVNAAACNF